MKNFAYWWVVASALMFCIWVVVIYVVIHFVVKYW